MEVEVEVVGFERPSGGGKTLYISGIPSCLSTEEKWAILHTEFSRHGLIYDVSLPLSHRHGNQEPNNEVIGEENVTSSEEEAPIVSGKEYGFVTYYSRRDARTAVRETQRNVIILNKPFLLKVEMARPRNKPRPTTPTSQRLFLGQCVALCNHYIGFNGWSLNIVSMETIYEEKDRGRRDWTGISCKVAVELRGCGEGGCDGVGEWRGEEGDGINLKLKNRSLARKIAFSRACEDAFSKILIILIPGKSPVPMIIRRPEDKEFVSSCPPVNVLPCQPPEDDALMHEFPW